MTGDNDNNPEEINSKESLIRSKIKLEQQMKNNRLVYEGAKTIENEFRRIRVLAQIDEIYLPVVKLHKKVERLLAE